MFERGLIHTVDIYPIERNMSNRTVKNQARNKEKAMTNIRCRIIKDEKIMFGPDIKLKKGDVIKEINSDKKYTVESEYKAVGFNVHHRTYKVKKKVI